MVSKVITLVVFPHVQQSLVIDVVYSTHGSLIDMPFLHPQHIEAFYGEYCQ